MDAVTFATTGCHFVLTAPSMALRGNWPGRNSCGELTTGRHWAIFPGKVGMRPICRLERVREELGWRLWWIVVPEMEIVTGMGAVAKVEFAVERGLPPRR